MGFDFSGLDAELTALGQPPANVAELAKSYAGSPKSLKEVDSVLGSLGQPVDLSRFAARAVPAARPPAPAPAGVPQSQTIALPDPVAAAQPAAQSGELALDSEAPRSGSFAVAEEAPPSPPASLEIGLEDDDSDADFDAEFAALSGPSAAPAPKAASVRAPEPAKAAAPVEEDPETDAVLALFDAPGDTPAPQAAAKPAPQVSLSDDLMPTNPPADVDRDPDAEFDALFAEATSPSRVPSSPAPPQAPEDDNVDALLRDLGTPRVPSRVGPVPGGARVEIEDPTDVMEFDAVTNPPPGASDNPFPSEEEIPSSEFEIVLDEDEAPGVTDKPAARAKPPSPPPPPGPGGEKRPSFLGRLFGPKKD